MRGYFVSQLAATAAAAAASRVRSKQTSGQHGRQPAKLGEVILNCICRVVSGKPIKVLLFIIYPL